MATPGQLKTLSNMLNLGGMEDFQFTDETDEVKKVVREPDEVQWIQPPGDPYKYQILPGGQQIVTHNTRTGRQDIMPMGDLQKANPAFFQQPIVSDAVQAALAIKAPPEGNPNQIATVVAGPGAGTPGVTPLPQAAPPTLSLQTTEQVTAPQEGFVSKIGNVLGMPGVQKAMGQFAAAIGGPNSVGGRLGTAAVENAEATAAQHLFARLAAGDSLEDALKDTRVAGAVSQQTLQQVQQQDLINKRTALEERRVETGEKAQETAAAESTARVEKMRDDAVLAWERLGLDLEDREFSQKVQTRIQDRADRMSRITANYQGAVANYQNAMAQAAQDRIPGAVSTAFSAYQATQEEYRLTANELQDAQSATIKLQQQKDASGDEWTPAQEAALSAALALEQSLTESVANLQQLRTDFHRDFTQGYRKATGSDVGTPEPDPDPDPEAAEEGGGSPGAAPPAPPTTDIGAAYQAKRRELSLSPRSIMRPKDLEALARTLADEQATYRTKRKEWRQLYKNIYNDLTRLNRPQRDS